jgi:hypothetical protein
MSQIILSDEQLKAVRAATDAIAIRDQEGHLIGYVARPPSPEEISEAKRRLQSNGPWYSTAEVLDHLKSLDGG